MLQCKCRLHFLQLVLQRDGHPRPPPRWYLLLQSHKLELALPATTITAPTPKQQLQQQNAALTKRATAPSQQRTKPRSRNKRKKKSRLAKVTMRMMKVSRGTVIVIKSVLERWLRATMMLVRRSGFTCRVWAWRSRLVEMVRSSLLTEVSW